MRQTIYKRERGYHEEGSNLRELADQPRDLTTEQTTASELIILDYIAMRLSKVSIPRSSELYSKSLKPFFFRFLLAYKKKINEDGQIKTF